MTAHAKNGCKTIPSRLYSTRDRPSLDEFRSLCSQSISLSDCPLASAVQSNVPIYTLNPWHSRPSNLDALQDEWNHVLLSGPGVFVVKNLYTDLTLIDHINEVFNEIIAIEKLESTNSGDHFASAGKNSRIWNSFSKHCIRDAQSFVEYYSNPWLAAICEAWLGAGYRVTAQVNIVHPGGQPQVCHRDYHLGFQSTEACSRFPKAMQSATQFLTLQGAVSHTHMPLDSGPTRLLPFSQMFEAGYMAYRRPEFNEFFLQNYVSLPLDKGDGLFFNPALFHAAGSNTRNDFSRSANLLQISSAFGKPMESIDTLPLIKDSWRYLCEMYEADGGFSDRLNSIISAVAEGYPFPTNLDRRKPSPAGMAPLSEAELVRDGVTRGLKAEEMVASLKEMREDARA